MLYQVIQAIGRYNDIGTMLQVLCYVIGALHYLTCRKTLLMLYQVVGALFNLIGVMIQVPFIIISIGQNYRYNALLGNKGYRQVQCCRCFAMSQGLYIIFSAGKCFRCFTRLQVLYYLIGTIIKVLYIILPVGQCYRYKAFLGFRGYRCNFKGALHS